MIMLEAMTIHFAVATIWVNQLGGSIWLGLVYMAIWGVGGVSGYCSDEMGVHRNSCGGEGGIEAIAHGDVGVRCGKCFGEVQVYGIAWGRKGNSGGILEGNSGLPAWHFKEVVGVGRGCFAVQRYKRRGGKKLRLIWAGRAVHIVLKRGGNRGNTICNFTYLVPEVRYGLAMLVLGGLKVWQVNTISPSE
nr:hypothetical protein [Tanacetum cinerariifolium]